MSKTNKKTQTKKSTSKKITINKQTSTRTQSLKQNTTSPIKTRNIEKKDIHKNVVKQDKNFKEKAIDFIKNNKDNIIVCSLVLLVFIIGIFVVGFLYSLLIAIFILCLNYKNDILFLIKKYILKKNVVKKEVSKDMAKKKTSKKVKKKKKLIFKIIKWIILICVFIAIIAMLGIGYFIYNIIESTEEFDADKLYSQESTIIYDDSGNIIAKLGSEMREKVEYEDLPQVLVDAIVATEDSRFFQHNGFDLSRFLVASIYQVFGVDAGGASTLTMQVSKNNFTDTIATGIEGIKRKIQDIYVSIFQIEEQYTKEEIIEFYVNSYYLGAGAYGVEQASLTYFNKSASELTLAEASIIAGLFQAPSSYNPYTNPDAATERRDTVLYLMERHGYITAEQREAASAISVESLLASTTSESSVYQGFIDTVVDEVKEDLGVNPYTTSLEIYTTMNAEQQEYINYVFNEGGFNWENDVVQAAAIVIDTQTGAITAVGNGRNTDSREGSVDVFNYATDLKKQIGSTAKPLYDYGPAFEYNYANTYSPLIDEEYTYTNGPTINNFDGLYKGFMTTREALKQSRNIPALKTFQTVSNSNITSFVTGLGLSPELENGFLHEAHAIGGYNGESPLSLAAAYAAIGNGGYYTEPYSYTKVVYRDTGEVVENKAVTTQAMSDSTAYMLADILVDTASYALGRYYNVNGIAYAAKTGTTNFDTATFEAFDLPNNAINDLWIASTNVDYSIVTWYGYDSIDPNYVSLFGNTQNSQLFQTIASGIFKDSSGFEMPSSVVEVKIENETYPEALLPSEFTPSDMIISELFIKGTEPTEVSDRYSKLSNVTNLDATLTDTTVTLTWDSITTPNAINTEYLTTYFTDMWADPTSAIATRNSYNTSTIGTIVYKIYAQDSSGNLTYLGQTSDSSFDYKLTTNNNITFLVKTSYTIFTLNASDGATFTFSPTGMDSVISMQLNGDSNITLNIDDVYEPLSTEVIVLENLVDVSDSASIKTTITRKSDNTSSSDMTIDTSLSETYTITYSVTYNDYTETFTRVIEIKES